MCEKTFGKNHELETHMEEHMAEKKFKCDDCDKSFYLEWRLRKHKSVHLLQRKMCRFFSSNEECPFEKIGCKFKHEHEPSYVIDRLR